MVKLNIDDLPQLSTGLNIRSIPAVFLIYKGNIIDMFQGIPEGNTIEEFFNTAVLLDQMQTDETIMDDVLSKIETMIKEKDFVQAHQVLTDSLALEAWKEKYGTQMLIAQAYCSIFMEKPNTIQIRKNIENLVEEKILDLPPFWQKLAFDMDSEIQRLEMVQGPDELENELLAKISAKEETSQMPDLQDMQDLAEHLRAKNRMEESIDMLLDSIAIDRNWNKRAAQNLLTDIFKHLGSGSELVVKGRKKLGKLLF